MMQRLFDLIDTNDAAFMAALCLVALLSLACFAVSEKRATRETQILIRRLTDEGVDILRRERQRQS